MSITISAIVSNVPVSGSFSTANIEPRISPKAPLTLPISVTKNN